MKSFLFTLFLAVNLYVFAFAGDVLSPVEQQQFLQEMSAALEDVKNFRVEFEQQRHLYIMVEPLISHGVCYFEKTDKMRWEITDPYTSILIYNSGQVAKFEIESGQARKMNFGAADIMSKVLEQIISWMQGDFSSSESLYTIQIVKDKNYYLKLIPKSETMRSNLKVIELHIDPHTFEMNHLIIRESAEDFIRIEYKNKQDNKTLPKNLFHIQDPWVFKKVNAN